MKIACIGGGPAGLYFALSMKLRDPRHEITVFERRKAGSSFGWGITFGPSLLRKLYGNDPESAREIEQGAFGWREQFINMRGKRILYDGGGDMYNFNRPDMVQLLSARAQHLGVRIEYGHEVPSVSQLPEADLVLAADGVNSRIRQANPNFGTDIRVSKDKYIWLGTDRIFDTFAFHFVQTSSGWLWAATYGVGSKLSTFVVQTSPETWTTLGFDTMQAADSLAILEELFKDQLQGHRLMGRVGEVADARWLNFRSVSNQCWHDGKVVLAGDSAHTTHFTVGQGTGLAIEDAIALAENVHRCDNLELALASYEQQRRAEMRSAQSASRLSSQWFEDLSRYIALEPRQFAMLLHARCSPLLPLLPPRLFYQLQRASREVVILRNLRKRHKPVVRITLLSPRIGLNENRIKSDRKYGGKRRCGGVSGRLHGAGPGAYGRCGRPTERRPRGHGAWLLARNGRLRRLQRRRCHHF
jgi:2-polyprenyl-6-methoxyphenol hydroxylase-like FAD-dependent oxidoreductase